MLIARTEAALQYGLDEAIERCLLARELGAEMTLVIGLMNQEQAEYVAKYDKAGRCGLMSLPSTVCRMLN